MKPSTVEVGTWSDGTVTVQLNDSIEELSREAAEELVAKLVWALESAKKVGGYKWEWVEDEAAVEPEVEVTPAHDATWTWADSYAPGIPVGEVDETPDTPIAGPIADRGHWYLDPEYGLIKSTPDGA